MNSKQMNDDWSCDICGKEPKEELTSFWYDYLTIPKYYCEGCAEVRDRQLRQEGLHK